MIVPDNIKDLKVSGIYCIKSTIDDKVYIGSSKNINRRCSQHKSDIKYDRCNIKFREFCEIHGKGNFKFEVLQLCEKRRLQSMEQLHIDVYKSFEEGFNVLPKAYKFDNYKCIGSKNTSHKLIESDVELIKKALLYGYPAKFIYLNTPVNISTINCIKWGTKWRHVSISENLSPNDIKQIINKFGVYHKKYNKLTNSNVLEIKNNINNLKTRDFAILFKVSMKSIQDVMYGKSHKK